MKTYEHYLKEGSPKEWRAMLASEMPVNTVIGDPLWWADKLWARAMRIHDEATIDVNDATMQEAVRMYDTLQAREAPWQSSVLALLATQVARQLIATARWRYAMDSVTLNPSLEAMYRNDIRQAYDLLCMVGKHQEAHEAMRT